MAEAVDVRVVIGGRELRAGRMWSHRRAGHESASFTYDDSYLADPDAYALEPGLPLLGGPQHTPVGRAMFASFSDCAPDRWGRRLLHRDEGIGQSGTARPSEASARSTTCSASGTTSGRARCASPIPTTAPTGPDHTRASRISSTSERC
jgi:hypothetical protein